MSTLRTLRMSALALLFTTLPACDDGDPVDAGPDPMIATSTDRLDFATLDVAFGAGAPMSVELRNDGAAVLTVSDVMLAGSAAGAFVYEGMGAFVLAPGETRPLVVAFDPDAAGTAEAVLRIQSDDPTTSTLEIDLVGEGASAPYRQVDRMGIPALNTVFNHPPVFSKTAYNTATPADDLASYRAQFETVLGAVANPDPVATAALLLPDELPVSLGAPTTRFAELTGRALADDAVDVALTVTVGVPALQSDNVDANDRAFSATFPYLATPN